jgi:hypothetical protein
MTDRERTYYRWIIASAARKLENEGSRVVAVGEVISLLRSALEKTDRRNPDRRQKAAQ